jgi:molecular chaperone GrpE
MEGHQGYGKARRVPIKFLDGKSKDSGWPTPSPAEDDRVPALPGAGDQSERAAQSVGAWGEMAQNRQTGGAGIWPAKEAIAESCEAAPEVEAREVAELRVRVADLEDRWKRAAADLDNYRKRFDRELDRLRLAEREAIFRAWLTIVDDLERALCSQGASSNPWYEGMEAIHERMLTVLAQFGVRPFVPQGETFDPARHEAVATANLPDQPEGRIVEVVTTGYLLDGKILRPARVIAAKHAE